MELVISNYDTGQIYQEIKDVSPELVMAYSNSDVVIIGEDEFLVESVVMEHDSKILNIMVVLADVPREEVIKD